MAPDLVAAVPSRRHARRSVASALAGNAWVQDITGPRTVPVMVQYVQVRERLNQEELRHGVQGALRWRWTTSGKYSASFAYSAMFIGQTHVLGTKELWKVKAPNKCRFSCAWSCTCPTGRRSGCGGTSSATTRCVPFVSKAMKPLHTSWSTAPLPGRSGFGSMRLG
jgi:hypothetical protein